MCVRVCSVTLVCSSNPQHSKTLFVQMDHIYHAYMPPISIPHILYTCSPCSHLSGTNIRLNKESTVGVLHPHKIKGKCWRCDNGGGVWSGCMRSGRGYHSVLPQTVSGYCFVSIRPTHHLSAIPPRHLSDEPTIQPTPHPLTNRSCGGGGVPTGEPRQAEARACHPYQGLCD